MTIIYSLLGETIYLWVLCDGLNPWLVSDFDCKVLGTFSEDEVKKICADLDKSKAGDEGGIFLSQPLYCQDGEVSYHEFELWQLGKLC